MSTLSDISKRIGWEPHTLPIPSAEDAKLLMEQVKNSDVVAFEKVFALHRFMPSGSTEAEIDAQRILFEAYTAGTKLWGKD